MGHKLTPEEKKQCADHVRKAEQMEYPEATITVVIGDEIDDGGEVKVNVIRTTFGDLPPGWNPSNA